MIEIPTEYLSIAQAITLTEICGEWDTIRDTMVRGILTLDGLIRFYDNATDKTLNAAPELSMSPEDESNLRKVKQQMSTPLFRQYLAGRLGMM